MGPGLPVLFLTLILAASSREAVLETHQKAVVSAQHGVAEGWTRTVVTRRKASVQTPGASCHLGRIHAKHVKIHDNTLGEQHAGLFLSTREHSDCLYRWRRK